MKGIRIALLALLVFSITGCLDTGNKEYIVNVISSSGIQYISETNFITTRNKVDQGSSNSITFISEYDREVVDILTDNCNIDYTSVSFSITSITDDCNITIITQEKEITKGISLSTDNTWDFVSGQGGYGRLNIEMVLSNKWSELNIDNVNVVGVIYRLVRNDDGKQVPLRLDNFNINLKHISSVQSASRTIYLDPRARRHDNYLIEIIDVTNCSFGIWNTSSCKSAVQLDNEKEHFYWKGNICMRGDDMCNQYF